MFAVYHDTKGYYNFTNGAFDADPIHSINFPVKHYMTSDRELAQRIAAKHNAWLIKI